MSSGALKGAAVVALVALTGSPVLADPSVIGTTRSHVVNGVQLDVIKNSTQAYFTAALGDDADAFYNGLAPNYVGVTRSGKRLSAAQVYATVNVLKQRVSGIVGDVHVVSAKQAGNTISETAVVSGVADIIDSQGARSASASWTHQLTWNKQADGTLLMTQDVVLKRY